MTFPWRKLFQSIQDDIEGVGNAVFGDRAERLLDEEIREVDELLHNTRNEHAAAKARRIDTQQRAQQLKAEIRETEAAVEAQLKRRRTTAARDAAGEVVRLHAQLADMQADAAEMELQEAKFAQLQSQLEHRLRRLKHQLDTQRATASLQRAQAAVARRQPGNAPYPEPAPASAKRMRHPAKTSGKPTGQSAHDDAGTVEIDPVADVLERIAKRIKPRPTTNTPSTEKARRR
ncbi:PspA/IM30 family protein [Thermomonas sp. HDW16]|uniref:PspA/IM30 family protein n=1 Tax=Thermomonas sp. HDW16 TaxID=2714945 RepID=UPI00140789D1|nr:PspA/IM30 family protein [Thermomonas sp. HDW16]QIL19372.1 hypothetical protein G7079_00705 [Thermomonas sp. HDW16]